MDTTNLYLKRELILVINLILRMFNLHWTEKLGLYYKYEMCYSHLGFILTKDFNEVLNFLGLDTNKYNKHFYTMENFLSLLEECKYLHIPSLYIDPEIFSDKLLYFHTKFKEAITKNAKTKKYKLKNKYLPYKHKNNYVKFLDRSFNKKGSILFKIKQLDKHKSSLRKKFIKNKFNGNLIIDQARTEWLTEHNWSRVAQRHYKLIKAGTADTHWLKLKEAEK
ncbi:MAG TPA: hypothetical protein VK982_06110 [Bacteroidales bacterium]|nr:hypothetical protein [Bacteroidales bacterium]